MITPKGNRFVWGNLGIPSRVLHLNNVVLGYDRREMISIDQHGLGDFDLGSVSDAKTVANADLREMQSA